MTHRHLPALALVEASPAAVHCCSGTSGEGNDHDDAIAIGMLVVGAFVLTVLVWGVSRFMGWRSSRRNDAEGG